MVNLTIVARRPDCGLAADDLATPTEPGGEDDGPIDELMTKLRSRKDTSHLVRRASALQDIINILGSIKQELQIIQIVGHGLIGAVELGDFWFHKWQTRPTDKRIYTIDSNVNHVGILKGKIATPTNIRMLGCLAGAPGSPPAKIEDGPTFVFALSQLWRTEVTAPRETFDADAFDAEGMYSRVDTLVRVARLNVTVPRLPPVMHAPEPPSSPERLDFVRMVSAPMFARASSPEAKLAPVTIAPLSKASFSKIAFKESFSSAELVFEATWQGAKWTCEVIADGTLLRMRSGATTEHLVPDASALAEIQAIVAQLSERSYSL